MDYLRNTGNGILEKAITSILNSYAMFLKSFDYLWRLYILYVQIILILVISPMKGSKDFLVAIGLNTKSTRIIVNSGFSYNTYTSTETTYNTNFIGVFMYLLLGFITVYLITYLLVKFKKTE